MGISGGNHTDQRKRKGYVQLTLFIMQCPAKLDNELLCFSISLHRYYRNSRWFAKMTDSKNRYWFCLSISNVAISYLAVG